MAEVEVRGIRELARAFKQVGSDTPAELRSELLPVAQMVVSAVASKVPNVSGRAAGSLRARASQSGASIAFGGNAAPYYPWLDFGGTTGKGHRPGVPWSGSIHRDMPVGGRYVYPTLEGQRANIDKAVEGALIRAAKRAAFGTR